MRKSTHKVGFGVSCAKEEKTVHHPEGFCCEPPSVSPHGGVKENDLSCVGIGRQVVAEVGRNGARWMPSTA